MARTIQVDTLALLEAAGRISQINDALDAAKSSLSRINCTTLMRVESSSPPLRMGIGRVQHSNLMPTMSSYRTALRAYQGYVDRLRGKVRSAAERFEATERSLMGKQSEGSEVNSGNDRDNSYVQRIPGNIGAPFVVSLLKNGNKTLKGLWEWNENNRKLGKLARMDPGKATAVGLKRLLKLNDLYSGKASTASSWSTRFYNNFQKLDGPLERFKGGGAKAAFAWTGLALNATGNAISNYEKAKSGEISTGRAVAATITETAIDVGKDWLVGAAVTAGVAATIGSAPVIVVAAATIGVSVGLDWASKKITGTLTGTEKGVTEALSDLVLDVGEVAIAKTKQVTSSVVSSVKSGWSNLKTQTKKGFSPLFGY